MKKVLLFPLALSIVFSACSRAPTALPADEVIRRTIFATQTLDSVAFEAGIHMQSQTLNGTGAIVGVLHRSTGTWSARAGFQIESAKKTEEISLRLTSPLPGTTYVFFESGTTLPRVIAAGSGGNTVWRRIENLQIAAGPVTTPDPAVIEQEVQAIQVESGGLIKRADDSYVYRYAVRIAPEMLAGISEGDAPVHGTLTIDARNFRLLEASWMIDKVNSPLGKIDTTIDARFSSQNKAQPIELPTATAASLPLESIFDMFLIR